MANSFEQLQQLSSKLLNLAQQQQLNSEEQLQTNINDSAATISAVQRLDSVVQICQQLNSIVGSGLQSIVQNPQPLFQAIQAAKNAVDQHAIKSGSEITKALVQAVQALVKAQASMLESQAIEEIKQLIQQAETVSNELQINQQIPAQ